MSWQGQMTTVVRHLVNDTDSASYKFSDDRLETSILVAAQLVISETEFTNSYEINVEGCGCLLYTSDAADE